MSTYTVGLFISNFNSTVDNSSPNVTIKVHTRPDQVQNTGTALNYTRTILNILSKYTDVSYEDLGINKLDLVAVPHFVFGAMENWGLITFQ